MADKQTEFDLLETVRMKFQEYQDTTSAILDDYLSGTDAMVMELGEADKNFLAELEKIEVPEQPELLQRLEQELLNERIETEDVLKLIDMDDIKFYYQGSFDICVKVDNANLRDKLETFIKEEIYPYYLDQEANVLF